MGEVWELLGEGTAIWRRERENEPNGLIVFNGLVNWLGMWRGWATGLGSLGSVGSLGSTLILILLQMKDFLGSNPILVAHFADPKIAHCQGVEERAR